MKQDVKSFYHTSCHTDLAVEMKEEVERKQKLTGIEVITKNHRYHGIKETRIEITDSRGEAALGKPCGHYITLEMGKGSKRGVKNKLSQIVSEVLNDYLKDAKHILFVGLGNRQVTPDALGPEVMEQLTVTRHLKKFGLETQQDVKMLSALAPGVMAQTGMETVEAVRIANSLVLYVHGSQNYFNHRTNVDSQNRIMCFDIRDLGNQLKELGMLIVQDAVWNRVSQNRERKIATRYYCDEFHRAATRCRI